MILLIVCWHSVSQIHGPSLPTLKQYNVGNIWRNPPPSWWHCNLKCHTIIKCNPLGMSDFAIYLFVNVNKCHLFLSIFTENKLIQVILVRISSLKNVSCFCHLISWQWYQQERYWLNWKCHTLMSYSKIQKTNQAFDDIILNELFILGGIALRREN